MAGSDESEVKRKQSEVRDKKSEVRISKEYEIGS